jgi:hypothetical protein
VQKEFGSVVSFKKLLRGVVCLRYANPFFFGGVQAIGVTDSCSHRATSLGVRGPQGFSNDPLGSLPQIKQIILDCFLGHSELKGHLFSKSLTIVIRKKIKYPNAKWYNQEGGENGGENSRHARCIELSKQTGSAREVPK